MERTKSLENLNHMNHNLRDTLGRQALRAAEAAAPLPNSTGLSHPSQTKTLKYIPPFSTFFHPRLRLFHLLLDPSAYFQQCAQSRFPPQPSLDVNIQQKSQNQSWRADDNSSSSAVFDH